MLKFNAPVYLASNSPRRRKLLKQLGIKFLSISVNIDEEKFIFKKPSRLVKKLAEAKLNAAIKRLKKGIIITADTLVVLNSKIIGKPKDKREAALILNQLSDKTHLVYTGFSVYNSKTKKRITDYEKTYVTFRKITKEEIDHYVKKGSPLDKAGAYGIQDDFGAVFVKKINGCFYNVIGLPLSKLYKTLKKIS